MRSLLMSILLSGSLCACANLTVVNPPVLEAGAFLPPDWEQGVTPADLPADDTVGSLAAFGVEQTQVVEDSNGRMKTVYHIVRTVDQKNKEIREALKPRPWWKFW